MAGITRTWTLLLAMAFVLACAPPGASDSGDRAAPPPDAPKRITGAMMGNPPGVDARFLGGGSGGGVPGQAQLGDLIGARLTIAGRTGGTQALLAEAVPSLENGQWRILPDGQMETSWKIRPGARWHDGVAVTAADVLFTTTLEQDRELPVPRRAEYDLVERIDSPDPSTVQVTWKRPFIQADAFLDELLVPKHLLESAYTGNKENFSNDPFWNVEYIGGGPFAIQEWARDSHVSLQAFNDYPLGRPRIDAIVVKFLADEQAFMANILAGDVDVSIGKSVTHEQSVEVASQWRGGRVELRPDTTMKMWPQFVNPNPAIIGDVQLRKALVHAINRQEMMESIMSGQSQVAHSELLPTEEYYPDGEALIVRYDFDPRRATEMIEGLGYARGPDGLFRDSRGELLSVEVNATDEDQNVKPMLAVVDYWRRIGVAAESVVIPVQRQSDREYRATFPGFSLQGSSSGWQRVTQTISSQARLPENRYTGRNYSRYMNPEFDALVERFTGTIPINDRVQALQQVMRHWTDQLVGVSLYYTTFATFLRNRMQNAGWDPTWNAHEWDVASS